RERIVCVKPGGTQEVKRTAVNLIAAALGDGVDHAAHGAAIFGGEVGGDYLEFLHRVGRDLRLDAGSSRVLVVELLGIIVAVQQEGVVAGHAAECEQPEG